MAITKFKKHNIWCSFIEKNRGYIKKQLMTSAVCWYKDIYIRMQHACGLDSDSVNISFLDYKYFYQLNQKSLIV